MTAPGSLLNRVTRRAKMRWTFPEGLPRLARRAGYRERMLNPPSTGINKPVM